MSAHAELKRVLAAEFTAWLDAGPSPVDVVLASLRAQGHLAPELIAPEGVSSTGHPLWRVNMGRTAAITRNPSGSIGIRIGRGEYVELDRDEAEGILTALWSATTHRPLDSAD